jgi:hypothetical protein
MNAIEIEEAISALFDKPCEPETFPVEFLEAFGNKITIIKRLQSAPSLSDIDGAVLLRNNIHLKVCPEGQVGSVFNQLKTSPATTKNKVKFILVTDGSTVEAEDLSGDAILACEYADFPNHFGYFLPLAGIETVKQIRDSSFDIRATSRLNRLYIELLKDNPGWGTSENRHEINHFMARLIFCFFADDTDIFRGNRLFTKTIEQMSDRDSRNTNLVISEIFRALNTKTADRAGEKLPRWTDQFPYVNGGLFSGKVDVPGFSKIARSYLLHIGSLDWTKINPDIFGSMIQAVADDEERGALGMHYTSVPNILKVLNPLFLDDLRSQLEIAADNARALLNLRKRISKIRVFDPACGSGNFLVIAYKQMREIEAEINTRRGEGGRKSDIPLTNFRGIELRDFSAEIARLALIIAEYQCDLLYRGQKKAIDDFLPLDSQNWITCGNALQIDWLNLCPPTGINVQILADDFFELPIEQAQIDFENEGGETYICGNPPYYGSRRQEKTQKQDIKDLCGTTIDKWKSLDYVSGWFLCAQKYLLKANAKCAFVATSSICEGLQVPVLWKHLLGNNLEIFFGVRPFKWSNLASNNAGVTVVVVGIAKKSTSQKQLFLDGDQVWKVDNITPYLSTGKTVFIDTLPTPLSNVSKMLMGSMPRDGGGLILDIDEVNQIIQDYPKANKFIRKYVGSDQVINGSFRYCIWVGDDQLEEAQKIPYFVERFEQVRKTRSESTLESTRLSASKPYKFVYLSGSSKNNTIALGRVSSERRRYLPVDLFEPDIVISDAAFAIYDAPLWQFALISSSLHICWIGAVCGKLESRYRYSNTLGWNTFPIPVLTEKNKADLAKCAEDILIAREVCFPLTIADLYEPDTMPKNLRSAHDKNDEVLERIYIGRRFKNDTERLEKLFELYAKMTSKR